MCCETTFLQTVHSGGQITERQKKLDVIGKKSLMRLQKKKAGRDQVYYAANKKNRGVIISLYYAANKKKAGRDQVHAPRGAAVPDPGPVRPESGRLAAGLFGRRHRAGGQRVPDFRGLHHV